MNFLNKLRKIYTNKRKTKQQTPKKAHQATSSEQSDSPQLSPLSSLTGSPDLSLVFKYSQTNVSSYSNTEITLDHSTLEQLYQDKSIFSSQIIDQNFLNKSNSFLDTSMSANSSECSFNASVDVANLDTAVQTIHGQIRLRLNALKYIATNYLNIPNPVDISMLETFYHMKLTAMNSDTKKILAKFDTRTNKKPFFNTLSTTIKSIRQRSRSVGRTVVNFERQNLQRQCENKIQVMQFEILASLKELELHYSHMQELSQRCAIQEPKRPKYTTEIALKKRIRNRHKHRSCSHSRGNEREESMDSRRTSFGLDRSIVIPHRYKNECAAETMV